MENSKKKEILERLKETCQIPTDEANRRIKIIEQQEKEIQDLKTQIRINYQNQNIRINPSGIY